jgi:hypothetical protein
VARLRELVPDLRRLSILVNPGNPSDMWEAGEVAAAAATAGFARHVLEIPAAISA